MANSDVKVREIRLLEAYSCTYNRFMDATIQMTYKFRALFDNKRDEALNITHKIKDYLIIAQQKYIHAQNELEASARRGANPQEMAQRERAVQMYKALYEKAKQYEESAKKLNKKIQGEVERFDWMNMKHRNKLEQSKGDGNNFLKKAIAALNDYRQ